MGNLAPSVTERDLYGVFGQFGAIEEVRMLHVKNCTRSSSLVSSIFFIFGNFRFPVLFLNFGRRFRQILSK